LFDELGKLPGKIGLVLGNLFNGQFKLLRVIPGLSYKAIYLVLLE
jgi:hypothetical protein